MHCRSGAFWTTGWVSEQGQSGPVTIKRLVAMRNRITIAALLLSIALLRGPRLLSAWYNNLASLTLRPAWQGMHQTVRIAPCPQQPAESGAAHQVSVALRLDAQSTGARMNAARLAWLRGECEAALEQWTRLASSDALARLEHANGLFALGRQAEALEQYRRIGAAPEYLRLRGVLSEAGQDEEAAITWYRLSMEVLPTQDTAATLATLYVDRGQHKAALAVLDGLGEGAQGVDDWLWFELARSARDAGARDVALRALRRGAQQSDEPCIFWELQASILDRLEQKGAVETVSLQALGTCPDQLWPYVRLGNLRQQGGDLEAALHWYRQAEERWPQHTALNWALGDIYFDLQQYDQARVFFEQVLEAEPDNVWAIYFLAWCYRETGDMAAAVETLSRAIQLHGEQQRAMALELGEWYVEMGQHEAALAVLDSLGEGTEGAEGWRWYELAESAWSAGAWEIALQALQRGAQQSDEPCIFWKLQARFLDELEEWDALETISLQAVAVCAEQLWPYLHLGGLRSQAGDVDAALKWYLQAEELWPQHTSPKWYLGALYFDQQEYDQARSYFEQVVQLEPDNVWATYRLAWCYHETGDMVSAVETLSRAMQLHGEQPWEMALELGEWYVEMGRTEEALAAYRQALAWNPGDERIQRRIERLTQPKP